MVVQPPECTTIMGKTIIAQQIATIKLVYKKGYWKFLLVTNQKIKILQLKIPPRLNNVKLGQRELQHLSAPTSSQHLL